MSMKKTIEVDAELLKKARKETGASASETIRLGLKALVLAAACKRMMEYGGSEPDAVDVPRRREKPARRRVA